MWIWMFATVNAADLEQAWAEAEQHAAELGFARAAVDVADARVGAARAAWMPFSERVLCSSRTVR